MDIHQDTKKRMQQALDHFKEDLKGLRAGRANPSLLEPVVIEVYGSEMKLKEVATITSPEARQLVVNPFDVQNVQHIARAIDKANLGVRAVVEGKTVRVMFPELTADRRKDIIWAVAQKARRVQNHYSQLAKRC